MKDRSVRTRILSPLERFSEILFGLIMVLSFTGALSAAHIGREDVKTMFIGAIGCNLAWGIIDAAFYLITCMAESAHNVKLLRHVKESASPAEANRIIATAIPSKIGEALQPADFDRIREHLRSLEVSTESIRLRAEHWLAALGIFLLVFLSTLPVVLPFVLIQNSRFALHVSNIVAIVSLFAAGRMLARYAGMHPLRTGMAMVVIGSVLVALTIALGG